MAEKNKDFDRERSNLTRPFACGKDHYPLVSLLSNSNSFCQWNCDNLSSGIGPFSPGEC